MKSIQSPLLYLLIFILSYGCNLKEEKFPIDFGFKVESETDIINSFDSTYLRRYYEGDTIIKLKFSRDELTKIYNSIIENKLDTYPDNYIPTCEIYIIPSFETKLYFRINGSNKKLTYKDQCRYPLITGFVKNRKYSKIKKSIKTIEKIVYSKPEVKRMSDTNIIFL